MSNTDLIVRQLGLQDYQEIWHKMQEFTDNRNAETTDEIWLVEHHPVFTQGQAGKPEHLLQRSDIPVVQSDRGGQITYHGPGQQVMYVLIDIKRHEHLNVRQLVTALEQSVVKTLADYGIEGYPKGLQPEQYDCRDQTQKIQYIHEEQKAIDDLNMQTLLDDLLDEKETAFPQDREKQHIKDIELEEKIIANFLNK